MSRTLSMLRPVYVIGIGWHPYQYRSDTSFVELGLRAARGALADAALEWEAVESSYVATARLGMACGNLILRHLGALGRPLVHIENASASGSAAFRHACIEVAAGISDVALVLGVDKPMPRERAASQAGLRSLVGGAVVPATHFALLMDQYAERFGGAAEDIARIAVKNHRNGSLNPNAQRRKERSLEDVLTSTPIAGALTSLQCTPIGEGAAAVIVASEEGIKRWGADATRAVRVASSASCSQLPGGSDNQDLAMTRDVVATAVTDAGITPDQIDVLELHDAFAIEELLYVEGAGICPPGAFIPMLKEGAFDIGGQCAVSASGGLLAMGHPIGPTGIGQIGELTLQLRGEAGVRQHPDAKLGVAHMVGVGPVCYAHVLARA